MTKWQYVMLKTNGSISMNSLMKDVYGLLITYIIEMTWRKIIEWFYLHHLFANAIISTLIPLIEEKISKLKDKVRFYVIHSHLSKIFQVQTSIEIVIVDLKKRIWWFNIFDILCSHAIAVIRFLNFNLYEYCENYFLAKYLQKTET